MIEIIKPFTSALQFLGNFFSEKKRLQKKSDLESYKLLTEKIAPFDQVSLFFKDWDFRDAFSSSFLIEFYEAIEKFTDNPENHFHDQDLQKHIMKVKETTSSMLDLAMRKCRKTNSDRYDFEIRCRKYGDPEDDLETGDKLNELSAEVFQKYSAFLKLAKNKLITTNEPIVSQEVK